VSLEVAFGYQNVNDFPDRLQTDANVGEVRFLGAGRQIFA
jgi:hypothetical protein